MKFIRYPQKNTLKKSSVVTIGNFDGVHVGHQALINCVTNYAQDNSLQSVVVTMHPLAAQYFAGKNNISLLTPFKCKYKLLEKLNIDVLCMLNFNTNLSNYSAVDFMQKIIIDGLKAKHIIVGDDFRFGKNRTGDISTLQHYCKPLGVTISNIDSVIDNNDRVASSKIRQLLHSSDFERAESSLGRVYSISGKVSKGQQLGRELGFPTINIHLGQRNIPIKGVFCVKVRFADDKKYFGTASIGTRPTIGDEKNNKANILEVHVLDFNKQVYGQNVEVLFYHKIRNEVKFDSLNELKQHINNDIKKTRQFFDTIYREKKTVTINYKETLNLPKTKFSMKAGLAQKEPMWLKKQEQEGLYQKIQKACEGRPQFILHDGPPYANGSLHAGHALNKILKDIIVKSKLMSGFSAPYVPGWDCHGLPIEIQIEKKFGKVGQKIDAKTFRQKCREYATKQVDIQREEFKRLGVIGEWDNPYLTKDFKYEADMIRALAKIVENGHVEKGIKPVNWCFDCGSALAEAEIEYQDKKSLAIDVAYSAVNPMDITTAFAVDEQSLKVAIPIWTTTPWTLPASMAVSLHAELEYSLVTGHENYALVIATELVNEVCSRYGIESPEVLATVAGEKLEGIKLQHPFYADRQVPVILGEHVTVEAGTGAVHTAGGHGVEDFKVCKQYGIEIYNPMGGNGVFLESTPIFGGQYIWKANKTIVELLKEKNVLLHLEEIKHSYPHCWRHKSPTAFRTTPQWFVSMDKKSLRKNALAEIRNVKWIPEWGESRIYSMIETRPEWCVSRQRTWGVPITLFAHNETGELHPKTLKIMERVAKMVEKDGIDAWFDAQASDLIEDADDYEKTTDVLDVWFDSGVSHFAVLKARDYLTEPADLYLEGSDQHRGWFHSSLLTSTAINNRAPYKQVLTHGYVVDKDGKKMSKSVGNIISPKQMIDIYGADILRLWCASTDYTKEITISDEIMKRVADGYRRIRNTARFLLGNLNDFDPTTQLIGVNDCILLDQWAINQAITLQNEIKNDYDEYQFHHIYQKLSSFCSQDMGAFYLDVLKDRLYTSKKDTQARLSAQTAMYHILQAMIRWMAPIMTYTADEIWHLIGNEESILFEQWYEIPKITAKSDFNETSWDVLQEIRNANSKLLEQMRIDGDIGSSLDAAVDIYLNDEMFSQLSDINEELRFVLITSKAQFLPISEKSKNAVECQLDDKTIFIDASVAQGDKCVRCWHKREDVGKQKKHPELCQRCVENVDGKGELRKYA